MFEKSLRKDQKLLQKTKTSINFHANFGSAEPPKVRQVTEPKPNRIFGRTETEPSAEPAGSVDH